MKISYFDCEIAMKNKWIMYVNMNEYNFIMGGFSKIVVFKCSSYFA